MNMNMTATHLRMARMGGAAKSKKVKCTLCDLKRCDNQMMLIDGTELKKKFGGNVTTALSFLFADVGANLMKKQLFEFR